VLTRIVASCCWFHRHRQKCEMPRSRLRCLQTNEREREREGRSTNRKRLNAAVGGLRHTQRHIEVEFVQHRSLDQCAKVIENLHIDRERRCIKWLSSVSHIIHIIIHIASFILQFMIVDESSPNPNSINPQSPNPHPPTREPVDG